MKSFVSLVLVLIVLATGAGAYFSFEFLNSTPGKSTESILFKVRRGESFSSVARRLQNNKIVTSSFKFKLYAKITGNADSLRIGEYALKPSMFPTEVLRIVTSGKSALRSVTFQEGLNRFEIATIVERKGISTKKEFIDLTQDPKLIYQLLGVKLESMEGYLFPDTYGYTSYTTAKELITMMVKKFLAEYSEVQKVSAVSGFTRHQIVILSSIVEKETGSHRERPVIASVFHNRLQRNMRLQTDPTVLYGIFDRTGVFPTNIRKRDLREKNRYNTYTFKGLPFGPISNPGRQALIDTVRPAHTDYLYFVSRNDGTSRFSKNYKDHQKAVRKYQLNSKARRGKSWRDLKQ